MRKVGMPLIIIVFCFFTSNAQQNVGINTATPGATLQVVGQASITTVADGITLPTLTGNQLKAKDANYGSAQQGTLVYVIAAATPTSAITVNVTAAGTYIFNGTVWLPFSTTSSTIGDIKSGMQTADHNGWIKLDGRAKTTLTATQQAAATALGIGTNLPNATNAVLVQNGGTLGNVTGNMSKTIAQANLPNVTLSGTTTANGGHTHQIQTVPNGTGGWPNTAVNAFKLLSSVTTEGDVATTDRTAGASYTTSPILNPVSDHTHNLTTASINGGVTQTTLDVTPQSLCVNKFLYLGQ